MHRTSDGVGGGPGEVAKAPRVAGSEARKQDYERVNVVRRSEAEGMVAISAFMPNLAKFYLAKNKVYHSHPSTAIFTSQMCLKFRE